MKDVKDIKNALKSDKNLLEAFFEVMDSYRNFKDPDFQGSRVDFINNNKKAAFDAVQVLETKSFYKEKDDLTPEFYEGMIDFVVNQVAEKQGYTTEVKLDNKVGSEKTMFESAEEIKNEMISNSEFKKAFSVVHEEYNKKFDRKNSALKDIQNNEMSDDMVELGNIVKNIIYYNEKETLLDWVYDDMFERAKKKVQATFISENDIPVLKEKYDPSLEHNDSVLDYCEYEETRQAIKDSFAEGMKAGREGETLSSLNNPISKSQKESGVFWNGNESRRAPLKNHLK